MSVHLMKSLLLMQFVTIGAKSQTYHIDSLVRLHIIGIYSCMPWELEAEYLFLRWRANIMCVCVWGGGGGRG